jgi:hypothetical protein
MGDPTRVFVEVVAVTGRAAGVEFRVRLETVEVWQFDHCCGVFDREVLRGWLSGPLRPLMCDEVMLSLDRALDVRGRVALTLPDVTAWTLSEADLMNLRNRL